MTRSKLTSCSGPPPVGSAPEAADFPRTHYSMSSDTTFFQPPPKYPDPPKVTHSEMPTKPPTWQKPAIIFPWEAYAPPATRVFPEDKDELPGAAQESPAEIVPDAPPASTRAPHPLSSVMNADWVPPPPADPWQSFKHINAWDQDPDIVSYMEKLQKHRTGAVQVLKGAMSTSPASKSQGLKLTDFPTEIERPSLPVTPAPIRKQLFWGGERDASRDLPAADGVPSQAEWVEQLIICLGYSLIFCRIPLPS